MATIVDLILNKPLWIILATVVALRAAGHYASSPAGRLLTRDRKWIRVFNHFLGLWLGILGFGHLAAVTLKLALGMLGPEIHLGFVIPFGFGLTLPGWWLWWDTRLLKTSGPVTTPTAIGIQTWWTVLLLGAGLIVPSIVALASVALQTGLYRRTRSKHARGLTGGSPAKAEAARP